MEHSDASDSPTENSIYSSDGTLTPGQYFECGNKETCNMDSNQLALAQKQWFEGILWKLEDSCSRVFRWVSVRLGLAAF